MSRENLTAEQIVRMEATLQMFAEIEASGATLDGEDYLQIGHLRAALGYVEKYDEDEIEVAA